MTDTCKHFWCIEPANGPVSEGICKLCSEAGKFLNSLSRYDINTRSNKNYVEENE